MAAREKEEEDQLPALDELAGWTTLPASASSTPTGCLANELALQRTIPETGEVITMKIGFDAVEEQEPEMDHEDEHAQQEEGEEDWGTTGYRIFPITIRVEHPSTPTCILVEGRVEVGAAAEPTEEGTNEGSSASQLMVNSVKLVRKGLSEVEEASIYAPDFSTLDAKVQEAFYMWLEGRGMDAAFIDAVMDQALPEAEQGKYVSWLEGVTGWLNAKK